MERDVGKRTRCACGGKLSTERSTQCRKCHAAWMRAHRPKWSELSEEEKRKARVRAYTNTLIRRGKIERQPCACGQPAQARHVTYDDPRDVQWACHQCWRKQAQVAPTFLVKPRRGDETLSEHPDIVAAMQAIKKLPAGTRIVRSTDRKLMAVRVPLSGLRATIREWNGHGAG